MRRALAADARRGARYTLVFADPPYDVYEQVRPALARLLGRVLVPGAVLVIESAAATPAGLPWTVVREKRYGDTRVTFLVAGAEPQQKEKRRLMSVVPRSARSPIERLDARRADRRGGLMPSNVTAICPGTFDPVTVGHLDIITRGATKFGRVIVGLIEVPQRKAPLFTPDEREAFLKEALAGHDNIVVDSFNELVVEFAQTVGRARHPQGPARHLRLRVRIRHGPAQ